MNKAAGNFNMVKFINGNIQIPLTFCGKGKRIPFSTAENNLITELHGKYGDNWTQITEEFNKIKPNVLERSIPAILMRWRDYLNPNLPIPFSREEDDLLREKVKEFGEKAWGKIQRSFPNRRENELKNRWIKIKKFKTSDHRSKRFTEAEIAEIIAIKQDNPKAISQKVTDIFNKKHPDQQPRNERGVRNILTKAKKIGFINKAEINTNQNSQNPTVNQNNSPQQHQNVSEQHDNFFQFDNDNFFNQDDIPELKDYDFNFDDFSF